MTSSGLLLARYKASLLVGTCAQTCHIAPEYMIADMPSNGIWLGDEGSGGHLGKLLVIAYLNEELPAALRQAFNSFFVQLCRHLPWAKSLPIGFVGSIAQYFVQPLHEAAARQGLRIDQMLAKPIEALAERGKF